MIWQEDTEQGDVAELGDVATQRAARTAVLVAVCAGALVGCPVPGVLVIECKCNETALAGREDLKCEDQNTH